MGTARGEFRMLVGFHAVLALLRSDPGAVTELYVEEGRNDGRMKALVATAGEAGVQVRRAPVDRLDGLAGGASHQGVVAWAQPRRGVASLEAILDGLREPPLFLALDGVTDPHNLGACLRVANAAGVHAVIAPKDRAAGITPVVSKVASGAAEATPYVMVTNLVRTLEELKERNIWVVGTSDQAEQDLHAADLPEALVWVLGAEGEGMRRLTREHCDLLVRIPMRGTVESLNVSVATGIVLYETLRRRGLPKTRISR